MQIKLVGTHPYAGHTGRALNIIHAGDVPRAVKVWLPDQRRHVYATRNQIMLPSTVQRAA